MSLRRHHPVDSGYRDHRDVPLCTCGSARDDTVHRVAEQDPEVKAQELRRVGERE